MKNLVVAMIVPFIAQAAEAGCSFGMTKYSCYTQTPHSFCQGGYHRRVKLKNCTWTQGEASLTCTGMGARLWWNNWINDEDYCPTPNPRPNPTPAPNRNYSVKLCSDLPNTVTTAVGYTSGGQSIVTGWYNVAPGQCFTVFNGTYSSGYQNPFYIYGYSGSTQFPPQNTIGSAFCINTAGTFTYQQSARCATTKIFSSWQFPQSRSVHTVRFQGNGNTIYQ